MVSNPTCIKRLPSRITVNQVMRVVEDPTERGVKVIKMMIIEISVHLATMAFNRTLKPQMTV